MMLRFLRVLWLAVLLAAIPLAAAQAEPGDQLAQTTGSDSTDPVPSEEPDGSDPEEDGSDSDGEEEDQEEPEPDPDDEESLEDEEPGDEPEGDEPEGDEADDEELEDDEPPEGDEVDDKLEAKDCGKLPRINPFFGVRSIAMKVLIFLGVFLMLYLLAVAMFRATVVRGGSIVNNFVLAMVMLLVATFIWAWFCFSEYTWAPEWCAGLARPEQGAVVKLGMKSALGQIKWLWWGLGAGLMFIVLLVLWAVTRKPTRPASTKRQ